MHRLSAVRANERRWRLGVGGGVHEARSRGIGGQLIEAVRAAAREAGAARVHWLTQEDNTTARALYDKVAIRSG